MSDEYFTDKRFAVDVYFVSQHRKKPLLGEV